MSWIIQKVFTMRTGMTQKVTYHGDMNGKLHSNAHGGDEDDDGNGAQLDVD